MLNGRDTDAITHLQLEELRQDIERLDERTQAMDTRLARLEGREQERLDRTRQSADIRAHKERRELTTKIVAGTVTVALAIVSALVSVVTAAKC